MFLHNLIVLISKYIFITKYCLSTLNLEMYLIHEVLISGKYEITFLYYTNGTLEAQIILVIKSNGHITIKY